MYIEGPISLVEKKYKKSNFLTRYAFISVETTVEISTLIFSLKHLQICKLGFNNARARFGMNIRDLSLVEDQLKYFSGTLHTYVMRKYSRKCNADN